MRGQPVGGLATDVCAVAVMKLLLSLASIGAPIPEGLFQRDGRVVFRGVTQPSHFLAKVNLTRGRFWDLAQDAMSTIKNARGPALRLSGRDFFFS